MKIRKSTEQDFSRIMEIYAFAREYMKTHGNPNQWGSTNWPPEELIHNDIKEGNSYVCLSDSEQVIGVFYFIQGKNIEPTYRNISEGAWTGCDIYGVVHRVAGDGSEKGIGAFCINWAFEKCGNLRIDTHGDNIVMQNLLKKLGFNHCGTIYVEEDNYPRLAFEKFVNLQNGKKMIFDNVYFITGTAYAGKSTMVKLLAEKYNGIACEENYHDILLPELDANEFPYVTYTRDLQDWHEFIRRSPEEYLAWINGAAKECEILELRILEDMLKKEESQNKKIFVDTNISIETLRKIAKHDHVLIMLSDPDISVRRFFERPDKEKQFLYQLIMEEPDPEAALKNYRKGLELINSQENYNRLLTSGFNVILRDEKLGVQGTLEVVSKKFGLGSYSLL